MQKNNTIRVLPTRNVKPVRCIVKRGGAKLYLELPEPTWDTMQKAARTSGRPVEAFAGRAAQALLAELFASVDL